jgi:Putative beta-barrel porin 2
MIRVPALLAASTVLFVSSAFEPVSALEWQDFHPYALIGISRDSNPLRLADTEIPLVLGGVDESDTFSTVEAGLDADIDISRQRLALDARIYQDAYDELSEIDHTGGTGQGQWFWNEGGIWSGNVGYRYDQRLRSFANQTVPTKDLRTENRRFAAISRAIGPGLRLELRGSSADVAYEVAEQIDLQRSVGAVVLSYTTAAENSIDFTLETVAGDFNNNPLNDYDQQNATATLGWRVTDRSRLSLDAGYSQRTYDNPDRPDYSGLVGRLTFTTLSATENGLNASIWRDISSLGDEIANYAVVQGVSVEPVWQLTRGVSLRFNASYENRDFRGTRSSILVPGINDDDREDRVSAAGLAIEWTVTRLIQFTFSYATERRDSNRELEEYDDDVIGVQLRVGLD